MSPRAKFVIDRPHQYCTTPILAYLFTVRVRARENISSRVCENRLVTHLAVYQQRLA